MLAEFRQAIPELRSRWHGKEQTTFLTARANLTTRKVNELQRWTRVIIECKQVPAMRLVRLPSDNKCRSTSLKPPMSRTTTLNSTKAGVDFNQSSIVSLNSVCAKADQLNIASCCQEFRCSSKMNISISNHKWKINFPWNNSYNCSENSKLIISNK